MILKRIKEIIWEIFGLTSVLYQHYSNQNEMKKLDVEIEKKLKILHIFLLQKQEEHKIAIQEIQPDLYRIIKSNTPENNAIAISLLHSELAWTKTKAITTVLLIHLQNKENIKIFLPTNPNREFSIFFGAIELYLEMYAYDEGDVHIITYEIELDVHIKKGDAILFKEKFEAMNLLGSDITEEIFEGFIL